MKSRVQPDRLFTALDGTQLSVGGSAWRVEVFGVIDAPDCRWVQVVLAGERRSVLTIKLSHTEGPRQVVRQIANWLVDPTSIRNVLQRVA